MSKAAAAAGRWIGVAHGRSGVAALAVSCVGALALAAPARAGMLFDDFDDLDGWVVRREAGHPGVPGARWGGDAVRVVADADRAGNRLVRLTATTDGTAEGTLQAQLCHQRKFLRGTYAARVRFGDAPLRGRGGDPVVQAFYAVSPLRHDFDPTFSEVDFEYLPQGGWGSERTRLYAISWQTVRIEPWLAFNSAHEAFASFDGWHVLMMQVDEGSARHYVDGRLLASHGGRNVPAVPMAIQMSLWFSPAGLLPPREGPRTYAMDVDWVLHVQDEVLPPEAVLKQVDDLRRRGVARLDTVPPQQPALESPCNL